MKTVRRSDLVRAPKRGIVRSLIRKGSRDDRGPGVVWTGPVYPDPARCTRCNAIYHHKAWLLDERRVPFDVQDDPSVADALCPACLRVRDREYYGRVHLCAGRFLSSHEHEIRARIKHIAARAAHTQPERRIVAIVRGPDGLEVRTTSQELAHRIAHELVKAFHGRATYDWSDRNGELLATWTRHPASS
jgi:NMD protein affecting ribosome stability and mRNA decay